MKRILCIINGMNADGAETMLMKLYREVDRYQVQFDFFVMTDAIGYYEPEIKKLGGNIYHIGYLSIVRRPLQTFKEIYMCVKRNQYKHILLSTEKPYYIPFLMASKLAGAEILALRSTNSTAMKGSLVDLISHAFRFLVRGFTNVRLAPSELAADFMFGEKSLSRHNVHILNNGLKTKEFKFNHKDRMQIRNEFNFADKIVVGNVGRFYPQKNHSFLIDVFYEISQIEEKAVLFLIGGGVLENEIKLKIKRLGLERRVVFAGVRNDVRKCLMAMDVMVFPSFYEGMPNVVIEAQATGLPCVVSDSITAECKLTDRVSFLSLEDTPNEWAMTAMKVCGKNELREHYATKVQEKGYDIKDVVNNFCRYMQLI